ncbi:hypothetical protein [uncultured Paludibaculum sp.]|uniref:hypothetical protein n=1 Tax=uncultured Paludibaculum sp. TaxID=1765020 RepID=UPI002AAA7626|nr:hypothetical protein [uncultured Paludibaculum sp.]
MRTLALLLLTAMLGFAQDKPNFTGHWELSVTKSDFAKQPARAVRFIVVHKEPELEYEVFHDAPPGASAGKLKYVINGQEGNVVAQGNPLKYKAHWEGPVLVVETWGKFGQNEIKLTDRWEPQPEGKAVRIYRHFEGPGGAQDQKLLFEKQAEK